MKKIRSAAGARGFTLIEAMIVAGIIAVIVALAYPTYIDQIRKARRADAESALLDAAQLLERCFTRFNVYNHDNCPDVDGDTPDGFYTITSTINAADYTLTASAQGDQTKDVCGDYTLDHLGNKTPVADGKRCWGVSG
ncbi:MAG: type IV pilin protein [Xanthomonadales bacterium]|nr:type IV pilin protein [Xanthomonadales bacterium]